MRKITDIALGIFEGKSKENSRNIGQKFEITPTNISNIKSMSMR